MAVMDNNKEMKYIFHRFNLMEGKTEEELDRELFIGTPYEGMKFKRHGDWTLKSDSLATPIFVFENGDKVAWTKTGRMVKILTDKNGK